MNKNQDARKENLDKLAQEVAALSESPLYYYRQENSFHPVFGEGDPETRIMFVGEAPGKQETKHGRPIEAEGEFGDVTILPLYHPAVALYNRDQKQTLEDDFQVLKGLL
jgi:uracil-DNA glycosylase